MADTQPSEEGIKSPIQMDDLPPEAKIARPADPKKNGVSNEALDLIQEQTGHEGIIVITFPTLKFKKGDNFGFFITSRNVHPSQQHNLIIMVAEALAGLVPMKKREHEEIEIRKEGESQP